MRIDPPATADRKSRQPLPPLGRPISVGFFPDPGDARTQDGQNRLDLVCSAATPGSDPDGDLDSTCAARLDLDSQDRHGFKCFRKLILGVSGEVGTDLDVLRHGVGSITGKGLLESFEEASLIFRLEPTADTGHLFDKFSLF